MAKVKLGPVLINALHNEPPPTERDTDLQRKWPEFTRVWASLLARPGLHLGMAAALKTQDKALLREIDDLYANAGGDI